MSSDTSTTMQFEYDPELLIEEVKKRPGIWDYDNVNYRTVATRMELWNEVVEELLQPNVKVTKTEMRELVLQLQKKWKSVKDSFQKYVQNPNRTKRPYIYSKQLQFLLKNDPNGDFGGAGGAGAGGASSGSDDAPLEKKKRVWKSKRGKKMILKTEEKSSEEEDNSRYEIEVEPTYSNDEETDKNARQKTLVDEFAFASVTNVDSQSGSEDCDKMFLLSLLPHIKSIPEELRLNAKMELLRVLKNANHDYSGTSNMI